MLTIFDCDGVLVDSERLGAEVFAEQLAQEQISVTASQCHEKFKGLTLADCVKLIEREHSRSLPSDFLDKLSAATKARFAHALKPVEGVEPVLRWLHAQGADMCVASNGGLEKIHHSLAVTGLAPFFTHCYSADAVARGKPAPDLFLMAADSLGFAPADCVVIEDSSAGVDAARAARMHVLHYAAQNTDPIAAQVQAFTHMHQLPKLLEALWAWR